MTNRKAPYSHSDGSNCWTKDCSRRGGFAGIEAIYRKNQLEQEAADERARFQNALAMMQNSAAEREKATAERAEEMRLEFQQRQRAEEMRLERKHRMLPLLQQVPEWQDELNNGDWGDELIDGEWDDDWEDELDQENRAYQDNALIKSHKELEEYTNLTKTPSLANEEESIKSFPIRQSGAVELSDGLARAEHLAFNKIPSESSFGRKYSHAAMGNLKKIGRAEYADWVEVHNAVLNEKVYECIKILNDVRDYASQRRSRVEEYKLGRRITKLNEEVGALFSRPLSSKERSVVFDRKWSGLRAKPLVVNMDLAHPDLRPAFGLGETQRQVTSTSTQNQHAWLRSTFPEVSHEYNQTEELLKTANTMKQGIEDEYFVEQVSANYYPAIHQSLKAVSGKDVSSNHREAVIGETKAQLALIQDGLRRIIDSNVSRSLQETKAQTEFLRAKMGQNIPELELPVRLPQGSSRPSNSYPKGYTA